MAWVYLLTAGFLEIGFAVSLRESHGFSRLVPIFGVLLFGGASLVLLSLALRNLPIGTAYAVWTGIGAAGTAIFSVIVLGESGNVLKSLSIGAIVAGVIGLRLTGAD